MKNKRSPEELARREKIRELLQVAQVRSLDDVKSLLKETIGEFLESVLQAELEEALGYGPYEKSRKKTDNSRNGYSSKTIRTSYGDITLAIPRDRKGEFQPQILPKNQSSISRDMEEKIISMYAKGMSTGDIESHIREVYHTNISDSTVSRITDKVLPQALAWQERPLESCYPILYLDAVHFFVKHQGKVKKQAVYVAIGLTIQGKKQVLGLWVGERERASFWGKVLRQVKERGVEEVYLVCTDNLRGFGKAIHSVFPQAQLQICIIHQIRNTMKQVRQEDKKALTRDLRPLYAGANQAHARRKLGEFSEKWKEKYPKIVRSWQMNWEHFATFYQYSGEIRQLIYTTNLVEGLNRQLRKISKSKSVFPTQESLFKLLFLATERIMLAWDQQWLDLREDCSILLEQLGLFSRMEVDVYG